MNARTCVAWLWRALGVAAVASLPASCSADAPDSSVPAVGQVQQASTCTPATGCLAIAATESTTTFEDALTASNGGNVLNIFAGRSLAEFKDRHSFIRFNVVGSTSDKVPPNSTILSAVLAIPQTTRPNRSPGTFTFAIQRVNGVWTAGDAVSCARNHSPTCKLVASTTTATQWGTEPALTGPVGQTLLGGVDTHPILEFADGAVKEAVQAWVNGASQHGFRLSYVNNAADPQQTIRKFASAKSSTPPMLYITFTAGNGAACQSGAMCSSGFCVNNVCCQQASCGGPATTCSGASTCQAGSGTCSTPSTAPNGSACDLDSNKCTQDTCQSGTCTAGALVVCTVRPCNDSSCAPATGSCSYTPNANLTCSDGDASTTDTCTATGTCASAARTGNLFAWGNGSTGALGIGSTGNVSAPSQTSANLVLVSTGETHSVGVDPDGALWAWGDNHFGQLGKTASTTPTKSPAKVTSWTGHTPIAIAAGKSHTLAVSTVLGTVFAWGANATGQLGDAAAPLTLRATPTAVPNLNGAIAVAAGNGHSVVLRADGSVWTFGDNLYGQLGNDDANFANQKVPVKVTLLPVPAKAIAAGSEHTLALGADGNVYAWGSNNRGALGQPSSTAVSTKPLKVPGLSMVKAIAAGGYHNVVATASGTAYGWGDNESCEVGDGSCGGAVYSPVQIGPTGDLTYQVAAGTKHSVVLGANTNVISSWGDNNFGQLGYAVPQFQSTPRTVRSNANDMTIAAGGDHTVSIVNTGKVVTWGSNASGKLGTGTTQASAPVPAAVTGITSPIRYIAASRDGNHTSALTTRGAAYLWGSGSSGQIGLPSASASTPRIPDNFLGSNGVLAMELGSLFTIYLKPDGTVFAMGKGSNGELGNGGTSTSSSPVQVKINSTTPLSNVVAISAGGFHALALTADGKVYAWGYNFFSQTGRTGGNTLYASLVTLPKLARAVAAGTYSSYALMGDGTVMAWGLDNVGQLGDGTAGGQQATPVAVQNVTLASQVSGGGAFGIALAAGGIMGWGATNVGQLGTISSTPVDPPVQTIGLPIAKQIAAGATSMYFLNMDGTVWARGAQSVGELGDNMATSGGPNWVVASSLTRTVSIAAGNQFAMAIKQP